MKKLTKIIFVIIALLLLTSQYVFANDMSIPVEDQVVFNDKFVIKSGENYYGDIVSFNGTVVIEENGSLYGDIVSFGGSVEINGVIFGNVISYGTDFNDEYEQMVHGEIISLGSPIKNLATIEEEKPLTFSLNQTLIDKFLDDFWHGISGILGILLTGLVFSTVSVLLHMLGKERFSITLDTIRQEPVLSFLIGLILFIIVPILIVILLITIILIPVSLVALLIFILMIAVSISVLGQMIGKFLMDLFKSDWTEIVQTGVGTFVFSIGLVLLMKIPCIGWSLNLLIVSFAMGALILSAFGSKKFSREF